MLKRFITQAHHVLVTKKYLTAFPDIKCWNELVYYNTERHLKIIRHTTVQTEGLHNLLIKSCNEMNKPPK